MNDQMAMPRESRVAPHHAIGAGARAPRIGVPAYFPDSLREASRTIELAGGALLFDRGAAASACYRVVRGAVRLEKVSPGDTAATLQHACAGDWLHEPTLYDDLHGCSATAEMPSLVLAVSARQFRVELRRDPSFAAAWGLASAETARRLQREVERLLLPRARDRIVHYLATESVAGDPAVRLAGSLHDWAGHLGIAAETLSRALTELVAEGIIGREERTFRLMHR